MKTTPFMLHFLLRTSAVAATLHGICPPPCSCDPDPLYPPGLHVNCSRQELTEVPRQIPHVTTTLDLSSNNFTRLPDNTFLNLTQLQILDLSNSSLKHLGQDAFQGLGQLLMLNLSWNCLPLSPDTYHERVFQPLVSLTALFLNKNPKTAQACHGVTGDHVPRESEPDIALEIPRDGNGVLESAREINSHAIHRRHAEMQPQVAVVTDSERDTNTTELQPQARGMTVTERATNPAAIQLQAVSTTSTERVTNPGHGDAGGDTFLVLGGYPDQALSHLHNLTVLHMDGLTNQTFGEGFRNLTQLTNLTLDGKTGNCHLGTLNSETFRHVSYVQYLNISDCGIWQVSEDAFSPLKELRELDLSFNEALGFDLLNVALAGLSGSKLERLVIDAIVPTHVLSIVINSTHLQHFRNLRHLSVVEARFNRIQAFDDGVLCSGVPPSLRHVYLNANLLELASYVNDLGCLSGLELLHINGFDSYWTPPLRPPDPAQHQPRTAMCEASEAAGRGAVGGVTDWPEHTGYLTRSDPYDVQMKTREVTSVSNEVTSAQAPSTASRGSMETVSKDNPGVGKEFQVPPDLTVFLANHFGLFYKLEKIRVNRDNKLMRIDMSQNHFPLWRGPITGLENLTELSLVDTFTERVEPEFFNSFPSLQVLNISGNRLRDSFWNDEAGAILGGLANLRVLDLSRIDFGDLHSNMLAGLTNLDHLHLTQNGIHDFKFNISHMMRLQHVDLSMNQINTLSCPVRDHLDLLAGMFNVTVDMTYNPIGCTCQNVEFLRWIRDSPVYMGIHKPHYYCQMADGSVKEMSDILAMIDNLDRTCGSYVGLLFGAVACCLTVTILIVVAVIYRYRWKLRYLYYATRLNYQRHRPGSDESFSYDAFVSFAGEDVEFVMGEMRRELENGRELRLCIHERDFVPGRYIASNIVDCIQRSRHTLVVLTRALLASQWCHYELQMALMVAAETGRDVLLFLLYEHVPTGELPREVLFNIQAHSYTDFPHGESDRKPFWDRLAQAFRDGVEL